MRQTAKRGPVSRTIHHVTEHAHTIAGELLVIAFEHYRYTKQARLARRAAQ